MAKVGRPSKYKEEYCNMLIEHMSKGFSLESFAPVIGVNQDTLHEWCKVHPKFSEAKKEAYGHSRLFWEKIAIDNLVTPKEKSFNATIWIFNMKNRFGWRDSVEISGSQDNPVKIVIEKQDEAL